MSKKLFPTLRRKSLSALAPVVIALGLAGFANGSGGGKERGLDPPGGEIRTREGQVFREVRILQVDPDGLLFRHRSGAGKVLFAEMPVSLAARYQEGKGAWPGDAAAPEAGAGEGASRPAAVPAPGLTLTLRTRVLWLAPAAGTGAGREFCFSPEGAGWPSHWSRYHPGLAYARFPCRQAAERDFLISSGILPRPPGVRTIRFR